MYYEILYSSVATSNLEREELESIAEVSQRNNRKTGVSGILVYNNREFLQLLEGPMEQVLDLMDKISKDPRHSYIRVIWQHEIDHRGFESWDMGLVDMEGIDEMLEDGYLVYAKKNFSEVEQTEYNTTGKSLLHVLTKKLGA